MRIIVILLLIWTSAAFAGISSVVISNDTVTINGTDLPNKPTFVEWTGETINNGIIGNKFSKENWDTGLTYGTCLYDSDGHTGKSIRFTFDTAFYTTASSANLQYIFPSTVTEMYFSFWVKLNRNDSQEIQRFQWKNGRIKSTPGYGMSVEGNSGIYGDYWWYGDNYYQEGNRGGWSNNCSTITKNGASGAAWGLLGKDAFLFDQWQRIDYYWKKSTGSGTPDGIHEVRRIGRSAGQVIAGKYDIVTHDETNADQDYRYILFGQYYGNLTDANVNPWVGEKSMDVRFDDIYISNSRARVEIGNAETFNMCTQLETQPIINTSSTTIECVFNKGGFTNGDSAWIFVIDESGVPSAGKPIVINGTPSTNPTSTIYKYIGKGSIHK